MVNLDRFFISSDWENHFPLCHVWSLTKVGSDHSPICLDSSEASCQRQKYFTFEKQWLLHDNFKGLVGDRWDKKKASRPAHGYSMDN